MGSVCVCNFSSRKQMLLANQELKPSICTSRELITSCFFHFSLVMAQETPRFTFLCCCCWFCRLVQTKNSYCSNVMSSVEPVWSTPHRWFSSSCLSWPVELQKHCLHLISSNFCACAWILLNFKKNWIGHELTLAQDDVSAVSEKPRNAWFVCRIADTNFRHSGETKWHPEINTVLSKFDPFNLENQKA